MPFQDPDCQSFANHSVLGPGVRRVVKGFMQQRGSGWELRVFLGRDPDTGKRRYASKTVRGTKREAQSALAAMVAEVERGTAATSRETVGGLLERWFEHAAPDFSPKTVRETRGVLDRYLVPDLGSVPLAKLRADDLDRYYRRLRERGATGRPLAPATIKRIHGILRRALTQGVRWGWIPSNPAAAATPPRVPVSDIKPPSPAQLSRLFTAAMESDPELATFIVTAAATGARRSELLALRWRDVDLVARSIAIERAIVIGVDGPVEKDTKTHSARRVAIDASTAEALALHRRLAEERAATFDSTLGADAFVFSPHPVGAEPWFPDSVSRSFTRLCKQVGCAGVRLHDLRHYVATQLLAAGVDVRTVAGRLGHRNAATTLNVYSHFLPEADREAANVLERLLGAAGGDSVQPAVPAG